jgi:hypothetical protein
MNTKTQQSAHKVVIMATLNNMVLTIMSLHILLKNSFCLIEKAATMTKIPTAQAVP